MTRILVKMPNWVGDCIMATPAIALIKAALPSAKLHALCRPSVAGILQDNPHLEQVIAANERKSAGDLIRQLRATRYDAVALFTNSLGSAWLAFRIRAPRRIGFNREGRGILLTSRIPFDPYEWQTPTPQPLSRRSLKGSPQPDRPRHMVEYYLRIARETIRAVHEGAEQNLPPIDFKLELPLNREAEEKVAARLRAAGIMGKTLIGLNPGAAHGPAKRWSAERMGHLTDVMQRPDWAFVSTAAPGEKHLNDQLESATTAKIFRIGEETSLRELPALITRLAVLITNDSGAMHVAAARQVPVVALFGPTDWSSTMPWSAPATIVRNPVPCAPCFLEQCPIHHPCMDGIEPYTVAEAMISRMYQSGKWSPSW